MPNFCLPIPTPDAMAMNPSLRRKGTGWLASLVLALPITGLQAAPGQAVLELSGAGPYHTLRLPMAVQAATALPDLSDVHVVNARGEPLPMAWGELLPPGAVERRQDVPLFKLPAGAASGIAAEVRNGWILDARRIQGTQLKLHVTLPPDVQGVYNFSLEASDDLQQWWTVASSLQLLSLQHQGLRLDSTTVDLGGIDAGYLRLRALPGSLPLPLVKAQVTSVVERLHAQPMQWSDPIAPSRCGTDHCDYALPRHVPLEQLQVLLAEPNALAPVQLLGWEEPAPAGQHASRRQRLRDKIKGLRDKTETPASSNQPAGAWQWLNAATVYWLRLPEGEVRSENLWLQGGLYSQLRIQTTGAVTQLGTRPPVIRIGTRARSLVFLARGPAPYRLVWGGASAQASVLSLNQLIPTRQVADALPQSSASVAPAVAAMPAASQPGAAAMASSAATTSTTPAVPKQLWLWAVLILGVALMGLMVWSLLRKSAPRQEPTT
jgi:hypothetical protein